ncbi:MAG: hypothetical protein GKR98_04505 [Boseongicola sp.]|nr:MAG: hypothetical protein GKR98_04505 [Boseongicola sp.]
MSDVLNVLAGLRRPRLLIRAARLGMSDYSRDRTLPRLISAHASKRPEETVRYLLEAEAKAECGRRDGNAGYSPARHIEILIALMAEARLIPRGPTAV